MNSSLDLLASDSLSSPWIDFYAHAVQLATALQRIPDTCVDNDAESHLQGRCGCSRNINFGRGIPQQRQQENCSALIMEFREDLGAACVNLRRFAPNIPDRSEFSGRMEISEQGLSVRDLKEILQLFWGMDRSLADFRRSRSIAGIRQAKHCVAELHQYVSRLNRRHRKG